MISDDLKSLAVDIDKLKPLPGNPRRNDVEAVMKSYARFGQRKPIVAQRDGTVTSGNHQLLAAKMLGWKEIAVVYTDDDDVTAKAWALADNRIADLGYNDNEALLAMLADIKGDAELLEAAGYNDHFVEDLVLATSAPPSLDDLAAQWTDDPPAPKTDDVMLVLTLDSKTAGALRKFIDGYDNDILAIKALLAK